MNSVEKKLIKNLFSRFNDTEIKNKIRDAKAEKLIFENLKIQPNSPYYMVQTILIQEHAVQKLHEKIQNLEKIIKDQESKINSNKKSTGFLSSIFGSKTKKEINNKVETENTKTSPNLTKLNSGNKNNDLKGKNNSFLGSALQTAIGVAGGVVTANMLMNLFNHDNKSSSELFSTNNSNNSNNHASNLFQNSENSTGNNYILNEEKKFSSDDNSTSETTEFTDSYDYDDYEDEEDDDEYL
ncbi:DUF2076 family protein [Buchnera aphidicola (Mollitrichosiphum nigrofasciatum)]|uniref:DUF2076 domain-containing protein n=1 Tax=Buchnera aphidicola TaxID=9 RepID=UPI0031B85DBD